MADTNTADTAPEVINQALGEVVVAVLGIGTLLDGSLKSLTQEQRDQIVGFPQLLRSSVHSVIAGRKVRKLRKDSTFTFKYASKLLAARGDTTAKVLMGALPSDVVKATGLVLARLVDLLQNKLPRRVRSTMAGMSADIEPGSPTELQDYQVLWDVANDPLLVLHHLAEHNVRYDEVTALETLFPNLYQLIKAAVLQACTKIKAARPRWNLDSSPIGPSVSKLLQTQNHSFGAMLTAAFAGDPQKQAAPKPRLMSGKSVSLSTAGQVAGAT